MRHDPRGVSLRKTTRVACTIACCMLFVAATVIAQDSEPAGLDSESTAGAAPAQTRTWAGLRVPAELLAVAPTVPAAGVNAFPRPIPPPQGGVRKVPLIIGIAGAVVMVAGIVVATDDDAFMSFQAAGAATAVVGGAVAVTGFYFAFKR